MEEVAVAGGAVLGELREEEGGQVVLLAAVVGLELEEVHQRQEGRVLDGQQAVGAVDAAVLLHGLREVVADQRELPLLPHDRRAQPPLLGREEQAVVRPGRQLAVEVELLGFVVHQELLLVLLLFSLPLPLLVHLGDPGHPAELVGLAVFFFFFVVVVVGAGGQEVLVRRVVAALLLLRLPGGTAAVQGGEDGAVELAAVRPGAATGRLLEEEEGQQVLQPAQVVAVVGRALSLPPPGRFLRRLLRGRLGELEAVGGQEAVELAEEQSEDEEGRRQLHRGRALEDLDGRDPLRQPLVPREVRGERPEGAAVLRLVQAVERGRGQWRLLPQARCLGLGLGLSGRVGGVGGEEADQVGQEDVHLQLGQPGAGAAAVPLEGLDQAAQEEEVLPGVRRDQPADPLEVPLDLPRRGRGRGARGEGRRERGRRTEHVRPHVAGRGGGRGRGGSGGGEEGAEVEELVGQHHLLAPLQVVAEP